VIKYLIHTLLIFGIIFSCADALKLKNNTKEEISVSGQSIKYTAHSIIGYWESKADGLVTHITEVSAFSPGSGSFKDANGNLIAAGKFRNIYNLGTNKWECLMYEHSPSLIYPQDDTTIGWKEVVIEMLDINTFRVGNTLFERI